MLVQLGWNQFHYINHFECLNTLSEITWDQSFELGLEFIIF